MLGPKHPGTRDKNIIIIVFLCNSLFFNIFEMKLHLHENTAEGVNSCFLSCCTVSVTATFLFFSF